MPKWKDESPEWNRDRKPHPSDCLYEVFTEDLGNFISGTDNETRREQFIRAHNADINALTAEIQQFRDAYAHDREIMAEQAAQLESYEARMEEYEAELARVKAESLRVVVVPEADSGLMYDWYMTPTGLGYPGKDRKNNNCIESAEGYYRLDECKPVRLERWEDE